MYGEVTEHLPCWFLELSLLSNERIRVRCVLTSVFSEVTSVFSEFIEVTFVSIVVTTSFLSVAPLSPSAKCSGRLTVTAGPWIHPPSPGLKFLIPWFHQRMSH